MTLSQLNPSQLYPQNLFMTPPLHKLIFKNNGPVIVSSIFQNKCLFHAEAHTKEGILQSFSNEDIFDLQPEDYSVPRSKSLTQQKRTNSAFSIQFAQVSPANSLLHNVLTRKSKFSRYILNEQEQKIESSIIEQQEEKIQALLYSQVLCQIPLNWVKDLDLVILAQDIYFASLPQIDISLLIKHMKCIRLLFGKNQFQVIRICKKVDRRGLLAFGDDIILVNVVLEVPSVFQIVQLIDVIISSLQIGRSLIILGDAGDESAGVVACSLLAMLSRQLQHLTTVQQIIQIFNQKRILDANKIKNLNSINYIKYIEKYFNRPNFKWNIPQVAVWVNSIRIFHPKYREFKVIIQQSDGNVGYFQLNHPDYEKNVRFIDIAKEITKSFNEHQQQIQLQGQFQDAFILQDREETTQDTYNVDEKSEEYKFKMVVGKAKKVHFCLKNEVLIEVFYEYKRMMRKQFYCDQYVSEVIEGDLALQFAM